MTNVISPYRMRCSFCKGKYVYDYEHACFVCEKCGAALFPPEIEEEKDFRNIKELWMDEQRVKKSMAKLGSSRQRSKKRKDRKQRHKVKRLDEMI